MASHDLKAKIAGLQRGPAYQVGPAALSTQADLPERAGALPEPLQVIARQYIGARRRSGEALLEAARWLTEAKRIAKHGEWHIFLEATGTSDDTAERLLNIHIQAMQNPQFADAIARNWLSQSAAALLARESTPPELVDEILAAPEPPTKAGIEARLRTSRPGQNPHRADFGDDPGVVADQQRMAAVQRLLSQAAGAGERTGTALYQEAYAHAREIHDVTLYNRAFAAIDRAIEGTAKPPPIDSRGALPTRPQRPPRDDVSVLLEYLAALESYTDALEALLGPAD
jgi:hypothetical protein